MKLSSFGWLHMTDLHKGLSSQGVLWPNIEQQFFHDLEVMHSVCGPWDVLFFSGDLVQTGSRREFAKLNQTLERIYKRLRQLGSYPVLITVPGNHDLERPDSADPLVTRLQQWNDEQDIPITFWTDRDSPLPAIVKRAFKTYTAWEKDHAFPRPTKIVRGRLPGDFAATIQLRDARIGVLGFNSAFLQLTGGDYKSKLALAPEQLLSVCGENFTDWFEEHTCSFLMTHHPPDWLNNDSKQSFASSINVPGRFLAHLCGHMHEPLYIRQSLGGACSGNLFQGASLFGLELFHGRTERRHGYSCGRLEIAGTSGSLRIWPRHAQKHQAGHWHFTGDTSFTLESDNGTSIQTVAVREPALAAGKIPTFRVLVLSTDADLLIPRRAVADHLRKSLGIDVEHEVKRNVHTYDIVILLQAWRWEGGVAATLWANADESRRVAFLIDENADWPPQRLVEIPAYAFIQEFRASVLNPQTFSKPEQLSELVGATVTERLRRHSGNEGAGLKAYERSYLEFRIPAWRSGRTALSQPHLFDAADAKELYQPELYTALHGTSINWQRGPDGHPTRFVKPKKRRKKVPLLETERRVRLAKWLSIPELQKIALVGAPGGGKTIFLTRIAAALGSARSPGGI